MQRFEYLVKTFRVPVAHLDEQFTSLLNELGSEGWEVVEMSRPVQTVVKGGHSTQDRSFVFKRLLEPAPLTKTMKVPVGPGKTMEVKTS